MSDYPKLMAHLIALSGFDVSLECRPSGMWVVMKGHRQLSRERSRTLAVESAIRILEAEEADHE